MGNVGDVNVESRHLFEGTPYRCLGSIGTGGMGTVFLVQHREMLGKFAAKVIHSRLLPDARAIDRFRLEAQALGQLDHPHIVSVDGAGTAADGRPFLVMEYLKGRSLAQILGSGRIEIRRALAHARQYLSGLQAAHTARIIHRDFKPENIFITMSPLDEEGVKVLDFGLARVLPGAPTGGPSPLPVATSDGLVVGTPRYASPEAWAGQPVDERSDVYAAAVVLYQSLTGRVPYDYRDLRSQPRALVRPPPPPSSFRQEPVRQELDEVLLQALVLEPSRRFSSAKEFKEALSLCDRPAADRATATTVALATSCPLPKESHSAPQPASKPVATPLEKPTLELVATPQRTSESMLAPRVESMPKPRRSPKLRAHQPEAPNWKGPPRETLAAVEAAVRTSRASQASSAPSPSNIQAKVLWIFLLALLAGASAVELSRRALSEAPERGALIP